MTGNRTTTVERKTGETSVHVTLNLDGRGRADVHTGIGFYDHMWTLFASHGLFDLTIRAEGDLDVDEHHTVEDVAICVGQAIHQALGDRGGIVRTAHAYVPMDESLARVVVDLGGRPYAVFHAEWHTPRIGGLSTDLIFHIFETLAIHARMNLHAHVLYGRNDHHQAEALFKALARALDAATRLDPRREDIPSTKGMLV
ncbi:MAG: imidazoleglycerol-phosphate dehydratase HisB [Chloroflexi bacterium]|nr:imidazoleglycerol-phosphate dehydratase HisB [Chloroflexota bacterium]